MNLIGKMKRQIGYWLITNNRDGGYAYAKIHSNGMAHTVWENSFFESILSKFILHPILGSFDIVSFKLDIQPGLVIVCGKSGIVKMEICFEKNAHSEKLKKYGKLKLNFTMSLTSFAFDFN